LLTWGVRIRVDEILDKPECVIFRVLGHIGVAAVIADCRRAVLVEPDKTGVVGDCPTVIDHRQFTKLGSGCRIDIDQQLEGEVRQICRRTVETGGDRVVKAPSRPARVI